MKQTRWEWIAADDHAREHACRGFTQEEWRVYYRSVRCAYKRWARRIATGQISSIYGCTVYYL